MPSITSRMYQYAHTLQAYLFPNCTRSVPDMHRYEARKDDPQTYPNGDLMQLISMNNIAFTFLFRSPDQKTCTGQFTHL
jgi:hypothetical protein